MTFFTTGSRSSWIGSTNFWKAKRRKVDELLQLPLPRGMTIHSTHPKEALRPGISISSPNSGIFSSFVGLRWNCRWLFCYLRIHLMSHKNRLPLTNEHWRTRFNFTYQECLNRAVYRIVNSSSIDELPTVFSISTSNIAQRIVATQERLLRAGETSDFGDRKGNRDDNPLIGLNPLLLLAELG